MTLEDELIQLSHEIGREERHLTILGEGNTSADCCDGTFLIKASVETFLHSLCLRQPGVAWVGHTHTVWVLSILASKQGIRPFIRHVCPDAFVVCDLHVLALPCLDPEIALARAVGDGLTRIVDTHGKPPKVVLMENHGPVALGATSREVFNIMQMLDKLARVLIGAMSAGGENYLTEEEARRIDKAYRRMMIGLL